MGEFGQWPHRILFPIVPVHLCGFLQSFLGWTGSFPLTPRFKDVFAEFFKVRSGLRMRIFVQKRDSLTHRITDQVVMGNVADELHGEAEVLFNNTAETKT